MRPVRSAIVTLIGTSLFLATAWAAPATRIAQSIDSRRMTVLRGNVHPLARAEFDQGALDPSQMMHRMLITFSRTAAQQQALDQLNAEQQDPASANYHRWLTPEEFAAQFGMAPADLQRVSDWLVSQGFSIDEVARGGDYIAFSGSVGEVNSAFKTELHQYAVNGELHFANATAPSVPAAMAGVVSSLRSLNDFKPKPRAQARRIKPAFTSGISGSHFLTPDDFATIYNLNALYSAGIDGTGQKIAVIGQTDLLLSEVATFRKVSGLSVNAPQVLLIPNSPDPGVVPGDIDEASLDVEWSGAVARNATIIYVNSGTANGVFDALYYAIDQKVAPVISISYGLCEPEEVSGGFFSTDEAELQKAWTQGQVVVGPAGDDGAADCDFSTNPNIVITSATQGLAVDFPASSEYVVGVGGTSLNEGTGTYWSATNNSLSGSALYYIPEAVWNDTSSTNGIVGTGGGVSASVAKPSWQTGAHVPNDGFRDVPDVALNAGNLNTGDGSYITCSEGDCNLCFPGAVVNGVNEPADPNCPASSSPGYRIDSTYSLDVLSGTSAGVPTFAGMVALVNQKVGTPQGQITPILYGLASNANGIGANIFHDITSGDNRVPCTAGTPDCPTGTSSFGYSAGVGYDQTTGLGTIDAYNLVNDWTGTAPAADFGVAFFNQNITVTHGSSANILVRIQKQNGFSGAVAFTCASSISGVTCNANPASVNPDGVTTVTITASTSAALHAPASPKAPFAPWWESAFGVAAFFGMGRKRKLSKKQMIVMALLLAALMVGIASCGGGGGGSSTTTTTGGSGGGGTTTTTSGTVTLTATSGSLTHTAQVAVTVN